MTKDNISQIKDFIKISYLNNSNTHLEKMSKKCIFISVVIDTVHLINKQLKILLRLTSYYSLSHKAMPTLTKITEEHVNCL